VIWGENGLNWPKSAEKWPDNRENPRPTARVWAAISRKFGVFISPEFAQKWAVFLFLSEVPRVAGRGSGPSERRPKSAISG
jgi:hypothetical protein